MFLHCAANHCTARSICFKQEEKMTNKITVVITTWQVPFDQIVKGVFQFDDVQTATPFINAASLKWWNENHGDRGGEPYEPINILGYDIARYELWDGEIGFHAMLDEASAE